MAFSPPAIMIPKRILYWMAIGIAVVGGENAIQRPGAKVGVRYITPQRALPFS